MRKFGFRFILMILCCMLLGGLNSSIVQAEEEEKAQVWRGDFDQNFADYIWEKYGFKSDAIGPNQIAQITELSPRGMYLYSLEGIEYLTNLKQLDVRENDLTEVDLSKNINLTSLKISNNMLTSLDVSNCKKLKTLWCKYNFIEELDLSANTALTSLQADYNCLGCLDLSANTALTEISCESNIHVISMKKNDDGDYTCDLSKLTGFKASKASKVSGGTLDGTILTVAPGTKEVTYTYKMSTGNSQQFTLQCFMPVKINSTNFPDERLRNYITEKYDIDPANGTLSYSEVSKAREINLYGIYVSDLTGVEYFFNIDYLYSSGLLSKPYDISNNRKLTDVTLLYSGLSQLDVSSLYALRELDCFGNHLKKIDLSKNRMLEILDLGGNNFTSFDFSHNTHLYELSVGYNAITSIDLSANLDLAELDISENNITGLDVSHLTKLNSLFASSCGLTELDVSKNTELDYLKVRENQLTKLNVSNNKYLHFLDFEYNQISSIDLSKNARLRYLYCDNNKLKQLDISKLTSLWSLSCNNNQLSVLNLDSCDATLGELSCNDNKLTSLQLNHPLLESLDCSGNDLSALDITKEPELMELYCSDNQISKLNLAKCPELEELDCSQNQLKTLNAAQNQKLRKINAADNELTAISVAENGKLRELDLGRNHFTYVDSAMYPTVTDLKVDSQTYEIAMKRNAAGNFVYNLNGLPGGFNLSKVTSWTMRDAARSDSVVTLLPGSDTIAYTYKVTKNCSSTVTLKFTAPELKVLTNPTDVTVNQGEKATFTVKGQGSVLSYQWQYWNAEKSAWINSTAASAVKATFYFTASDYLKLNGRKYRCAITDSDGQKVYSDSAVLTVVPTPIVISKQPESVSVHMGDTVKFSVEATGRGLTYQWQYKNAGADSWANSGIASAKTANMTFAVGKDIKLDGRKYRCVITDTNGQTVNSKSATLTMVLPEFLISSQPVNAAGKVGERVTFSVEAKGDGLTYQWQYRNVNATDWSNSGIAVAKTANFSFVIGTDSKLNGRQYRCVITDKYGQSLTSSEATLTVKPDGPVITSQPMSVTAKVGERVTFSIGAEGDGLTYQWQYKNANAATWSNSGIAAAKTANMSFVVGSDKSLHGRQYRCIVTDADGKTVTGNAVTLTIEQ